MILMGGHRPLTLASWRAPPVWATLQAAGVQTASIDWPGARPGTAQAGVHIDPDFAEQRFAHIDAMSPDMRASMSLDVELGRPLELPWLAGAVVEMGAKAGVPTAMLWYCGGHGVCLTNPGDE